MNKYLLAQYSETPIPLLVQAYMAYLSNSRNRSLLLVTRIYCCQHMIIIHHVLKQRGILMASKDE